MNIQKAFNIDEAAKSWTVQFENKSKTLYSFVDTCGCADAAFVHGVEFEIINNY
jgi:hypothetical protein